MNTKQLRQKILDLAIRGKLVPQDPNDEPASALLQRIRDERRDATRHISKTKPDKQNASSDKSPYRNLPFEVPDGWMWCKLGEVAQHNTGKTLDKGKNTGIMRKYITTSNLYWGYFDFTEVREMPFEEQEIERFTAKKGDLLICEGGDAGRSAIWNEGYPICFQNHVHRVRFYQNTNTYYIFYYMMYLALSKNLDFYKKGVAIQSLSGQALSSILIPLPPLAEQHRIVSVIESAFALIDEIEESKTSLEQIIKHAKAKTLELAIKGKLCTDTACRVPSVSTADNSPYAKAITNYETTFGVSQLKITNAPFEVPEGWKWCRFSDLFILLSGRDLEKKEFNDKGEGIPYLIGASNVINGKLDINRWTTVPKVISLKNDLLLSCKGTVGELIINELDKIHIARQFMAIRSNANVNIYYTKYCFLYSINTIKESAKGIIPGISRTDILDLLIPLPPLAEQKLIVERIENIFSILDSIQEKL